MVKRDLQQQRQQNARQSERIYELEWQLKLQRQGETFKRLSLKLLLRQQPAAPITLRPTPRTAEMGTQSDIAHWDMRMRYRDRYLCEFDTLQDWHGCTREAHLIGMAQVVAAAEAKVAEANEQLVKTEKKRRALITSPIDDYFKKENTRLALQAAAANKRAARVETMSKPLPVLCAMFQSAVSREDSGLHTLPPHDSFMDNPETPLQDNTAEPPFLPAATPAVCLPTSLETYRGTLEWTQKLPGFEVLFQNWEGRTTAVFTYSDWRPHMFPPITEGADRVFNLLRRDLRGLVFDVETGEVLVRPLQKFFEVGQIAETKRRCLQVDWREPVEVLHKLDGAMVAAMWDRGSIRFTTRKGYTQLCEEVSNFACHGQPAVLQLVKYAYEQGSTPIFEYISPTLPFRVQHTQARLVLTAVRRRVGGLLLSYRETQELGRMFAWGGRGGPGAGSGNV